MPQTKLKTVKIVAVRRFGKTVLITQSPRRRFCMGAKYEWGIYTNRNIHQTAPCYIHCRAIVLDAANIKSNRTVLAVVLAMRKKQK